MPAELCPEIKQFISEKAKGLYDGYFLDLVKLCDRLGLNCYEAVFENNGLSGAILKDEDGERFSIYVNKDHHPNRQRFTIAHEIGHYISYLLHSHSYQQLAESDGFEDYLLALRADGVISNAETEANQIAAELLMPEAIVKELVNRDASIETMKKTFGVSEAALSIRLNSLGYRLIG